MTEPSDRPERPHEGDPTQALPSVDHTQVMGSEQHEWQAPWAPQPDRAQPDHPPQAPDHHQSPWAPPRDETQNHQPGQHPAQPAGWYPQTQPTQQPWAEPTPAQGPPSPSVQPTTPARKPRRTVSLLGAATAVAATALLAGVTGGAVGGLAAERGSGSGVVTLDGPPIDRPAGSVADIAGKAVPSVLTIRVGSSGRGGTGSGWVYDGKGHIVTNNHVVAAAGSRGQIAVELADGTRRAAELVGRDVSYDLAVLKVDPAGLTPLPIGESGDVVVGDHVVAVGSPLGLDSTVTSGIVSALERPVSAGEQGDQSYISAIQTDAAINPGNSGGPLLNARGEVVGVNSAIAQIPGGLRDSASGSIGVGFAIPSTQVRRTADQLIETGRAVHPVIGVHLDTRFDGEGARVLPDTIQGTNPVVPGGPADKAGVEAGDVITEIDGRRISDSDQLVVRIRAKEVGDTVRLTVERDGAERQLTMTLEAAKED